MIRNKLNVMILINIFIRSRTCNYLPILIFFVFLWTLNITISFRFFARFSSLNWWIRFFFIKC